jgi:hypothetical protein
VKPAVKIQIMPPKTPFILGFVAAVASFFPGCGNSSDGIPDGDASRHPVTVTGDQAVTSDDFETEGGMKKVERP